MLGLLRTTFALMVMMYHLLFLGVLPLGTYAVFGFYIISGYLMTLIMHESYGYTLIGRYSFVTNRFLRLYPQYWIALFLSILLVITLGTGVTIGFHPSMYIPISIGNLLQNIFIAFIAWYPNTVDPRLVPPSWALTVEIVFYLLICLGISKTFFRVNLWLFFSLCYVIYSFIVNWDWTARYFPVAAASLPFSIGATIYFLSKNNRLKVNFKKLRLSASIIYILTLSNCLFWIKASSENVGNFVEIGFYLNIVFCALLVFSLIIGGKIIAFDNKIDKFIGDYSYPIYLLHWQSGLIASYMIFGKPIHDISTKGFISFLLALIIVMLLSTISIHGLDSPIQKIRLRVKSRTLLKRSHVSHASELSS